MQITNVSFTYLQIYTVKYNCINLNSLHLYLSQTNIKVKLYNLYVKR